MNSREYLTRYGWKEGEALKEGGLKRPLLVKHKYDLKGVGQEMNDGEAWWERLFDGQLKALDVSDTNGSIDNSSTEGIMPSMFNPNADSVVASGVDKSESPLYRMFVLGEVLEGTIGKSIVKGKAERTTKKSSLIVEEKTTKSERLVFFDVTFSDEEVDEKAEKHKHTHSHRHKYKGSQKRKHEIEVKRGGKHKKKSHKSKRSRGL
ncbi:DEKNAAC101340 [Brettanomyces naardenensis]|uniref:DEKNAAC101340 n=1 Tax=Brettanomyces naardenensis TaxID=13370 RepID=A0A448YHR1_BRENA|nr:DEKNAAC101340 [Brettanomyces naardenensis]